MFIVLLRFADDRALAARHMDAHKAWIQRGFDDGVFVLMGSLGPGLGGALIAHRGTLREIEARVAEDPFVTQGVVTPEILEISVTRSDARLRFLTESGSTSA